MCPFGSCTFDSIYMPIYTIEISNIISIYINPLNIYARARLVQTRHLSEYFPAKTGESHTDIPQS